MYKISQLLHLTIFADDTNIFYIGNNPTNLIHVVNTELEKLTVWFEVNKLYLNVAKSNFMFLVRKKKKNVQDVKLNGITLEKVRFTKLLGVLIDNQFNWNIYIQSVKAKVAKAVGAMYRIKDKVDSYIWLMIYNTLVMPHLSYCCDIWGNTYNTRLQDLVLLKKKAVRIIDNADWREHSSRIFNKYKVLKLLDLVEDQTLELMYKANKGTLPMNIQSRFYKIKEVHEYNTRSKYVFFEICKLNTR